MAKKKRTYTPLQEEFRKERRRIQNAVNRMKREGFIFDENPVPDMPKRVTRQVIERLKHTTPTVLAQRAEYVVQDTGEIVSGTQGRIERRRQAKEQAQQRKEFEQYLSRKREELEEQQQIERDRQQEEYYKQLIQQEYTPVDYEPFDYEIKQATPQEEQSLNLNVLDIYKERIQSVERKLGFRDNNNKWRTDVPIDVRKNNLLTMLENNIAYNDDNLQGYIDRLEREFDNFNTQLALIAYSSKQENVDNAFREIARIIKGGSLSQLEAESISLMSEYGESGY